MSTGPSDPDDVLPPVEPPSAGFILQLFIVPGMIVLIIVMVWFLFVWLSRGSDNLTQLIQRLDSAHDDQWQIAYELANALNDRRHQAFRSNVDAARQLDKVLTRELEDGKVNKHSILLRCFLCRALGQFRVNQGMEVLLRAARAQRSDEKFLSVRQAALEAIAVRAHDAQQQNPPRELTHPELRQTMLKLSHDEQRLIRERAAYAMGVLGTDPFVTRLKEMLDDGDANVRYNAATALARQGDLVSVRILVEMMDPHVQAGMELELEPLRVRKRALIVQNAMDCAEMVADQNPDADLTPLKQALQALLDADLDDRIERAIQIKATDVLRYLERREAEPAAAP